MTPNSVDFSFLFFSDVGWMTHSEVAFDDMWPSDFQLPCGFAIPGHLMPPVIHNAHVSEEMWSALGDLASSGLLLTQHALTALRRGIQHTIKDFSQRLRQALDAFGRARAGSYGTLHVGRDTMPDAMQRLTHHDRL